MTAEAPPRRVRQKRIAAVTLLSVVTIVIGTFAIITRAGSQDNFVVSGFTALIFLPSLIAVMRLQRDQTAIFVCNVLMFVSLVLSAGSGPVFLLALIGVGGMGANDPMVVGPVFVLVWVGVTVAGMILWSFTAGTHGTAAYRLVREQCAMVACN